MLIENKALLHDRVSITLNYQCGDANLTGVLIISFGWAERKTRALMRSSVAAMTKYAVPPILEPHIPILIESMPSTLLM